MTTNRGPQRGVMVELNRGLSADASRIDADAYAGVVSLAGRMNGDARKRHAQTAAWRVRGVLGTAGQATIAA